MPFTPREMEVEKIEWTAGTLKTRELPKTVYKGLTLHLEMISTNAGGGATITADSIAAAIDKLSIVINGQDHIITIQGWMLFFMNKADFAVAPPSTIDDTAGATKTQKVSLYLPFGLTRAVNPEDTILDVRKASSVVLEITWKAAANGVGTDATITSGECQIETDEYANVPQDAIFARHELSYISESLSATGAHLVDLDYGGNNQYKRILVFTKSSAGAFSDAEIDQIIVRSRSFYYLKNDLERHYNKQVLFYSIAHDTGVYVLDFTRDGKMTHRLDARALSELILEVNVATANGTIYVLKDKAIWR